MRPTLILALAVLGAPSPVYAQSEASPNPTSTDDHGVEALKSRLKAEMKEELREEIRLELKDQLKAEIKAEMQGEATLPPPVESDYSWAEEEWKWEEPVKPELNFLEFDGYFRFRYDLFNSLDLGTYYRRREENIDRETGPFAQRFVPTLDSDGNPIRDANGDRVGTWERVQAPPVPACDTDVQQGDNLADQSGRGNDPRGCRERAGGSDTLGGANIRLRLEPVLNVYEDVKIKMQIDVLDNLVLGSTPDGFPLNPVSPLLGLSQTQIPPSDGINAIWTDSFRVRRAWAEIMTPLGQLRVGRMPAHFGLGAYMNEGRGIDSDFGDTVDRIMFATKIGDFYIAPSFDWAATGPTSAIRFSPYGQPFDRDQRDDVDQYGLAIVKKDDPEEAERRLAQDEFVLDFGTFQVGRFQPLEAATFIRAGNPENNPTASQLLERDMQMYMYTYWARLRYRKLTIEAEYAGVLGSIGDPRLAGAFEVGPGEDQPDSIGLNQHGVVVKVDYKLLKDALNLQLLLVGASGDAAPGWGVRPLMDRNNQRDVWDGAQIGPNDRDITNFRFDPDFIVDMILWRQLIGTITDALIVRPSIQYNFTAGLGARVDAIYSRAWFAASTPSGSFTDIASGTADVRNLGQPDRNLGLEFNFKLFYDSVDGFHAWAQYGLLIPFGGLSRQLEVEPDSRLATSADGRVIMGGPSLARLSAEIAHTVQFLLGVSF